jgi:glycosidase
MTKPAFLFILLLILSNCDSMRQTDTAQDAPASQPIDWRNEVIYHVMQRSFYDSNGDAHGDLNGFVEKLDYLQKLGVTTILFTPLYESGFYHNYFPTDYEKIDPEYGTMEDYIHFVKAVHKRGMKFLMDMETQYAQSGHIWFDDSYKNPASPYSDFIYYADSGNEYSEQIFIPSRSPLYEFTAWPGNKYNIVFLNLNHPTVKEWMKNFYAYWVDPNGDGNFDDGVDGFRIDHIMDDLDYKGLFTNMYRDFWKPIFTHCKSINSNLFILGEQSNWNEYGEKMVKESGADAAFSFPIRFAIAGEEGTHDMYKASERSDLLFHPTRIHSAVQETMKRFSGNTYSINFLENHDTERWATTVNANADIMRLSTMLNILLPGVPSIYYGQELGVTGRVQEWHSDANHIPVREAFPWTEDPYQTGMATWYKETGPWWDESFYVKGGAEKFALPAQKDDPNSMWNHYRKLIALRNQYEPFRKGDYQPVLQDNENVMAFVRQSGNEKALVILNLKGNEQSIEMDGLNRHNWEVVFGSYHFGKQEINGNEAVIFASK